MKANELMTGDYVRYKRTKEIIWIFEIDSDRNVINNEPDGYCSETNISIDDIESIPPTREILEKNGFVSNTHVHPYPYYEYIREDDRLKIGFAFPQGDRISYKEPWVYIDSENVFIEHLPCISVHQLQHVFRLCGLDNMANNFKV